MVFFFFKQKTAYEMRISDWSSDVCSSDLPFASEGQRETIRDELNLNDPIPVQYVRWLGDFVTGDFGNFYTVSGSRPVGDPISDALPVSFQLLLYAQVLALLIAIPLGVLAAYRAGTKVDKATSSLAFAMLALPNFVLALVLAYYIRSEEHTSELQSLMRISYAVFCLKTKKNHQNTTSIT